MRAAVAAHTDVVHALATLLPSPITTAASIILPSPPSDDPTNPEALEAACGCLWELAREPTSRAQVAQRPSVLVSLASAVRLLADSNSATGGSAVSALWGLTLDPAVAAAAAKHAPTLTSLAAALAAALAMTEAVEVSERVEKVRVREGSGSGCRCGCGCPCGDAWERFTEDRRVFGVFGSDEQKELESNQSSRWVHERWGELLTCVAGHCT